MNTATVPEPATGLGLLVISTMGAGSVLRHKQQ
ncbi:PEP-CTERM sorting domain-containing protein [Coleofasciculus chthonoplastes]